MIKYSKELEEQGFFVQRYEDRFLGYPGNLSKYPWGTKMDGKKKKQTRFQEENLVHVLIYPL